MCKILSPQLCEDRCVRSQGLPQPLKGSHFLSVLNAVVAFEAIELSSPTWMKLCRGFPWLRSVLPCCLCREQAPAASLLQQAGFAISQSSRSTQNCKRFSSVALLPHLTGIKSQQHISGELGCLRSSLLMETPSYSLVSSGCLAPPGSCRHER